jgi:peptide/nickel transport system ATP-binding protein
MTTLNPRNVRPADGAAATARLDGDVVLDVQGLSVDYMGGPEPVRACDDISFSLRRGEILGIAGESGSGKSTLVTAVTRLQHSEAVTSAGRILFATGDGDVVDLAQLDEARLRALRWTRISLVMQSAMHSLNPVARLRDQFVDVMRTHEPALTKKAAVARASSLLGMVGIAPERIRDYPHQLSGGMRQRAAIAMALACRPSLVVFDEPTTAVDVVMQRQILRHVLRLRAELGFAAIFVSHDLSLLLEIADRIAIMYAGRIVELTGADEIYHDPRHPYTAGLRNSFPPLHGLRQRLEGIPGSPPNLSALPTGCPFHPRCPRKTEECTTIRPELTIRAGREVACYHPVDNAPDHDPDNVTDHLGAH